MDQQYQEKLGIGLKLPDKDTTLYIKKLLQELQSSIAGLKTTIAQLEEKQEKERELKTSLESMNCCIEAERICQQRVTELPVLHQEEEAGRMAGAIQDELHLYNGNNVGIGALRIDPCRCRMWIQLRSS